MIDETFVSKVAELGQKAREPQAIPVLPGDVFRRFYVDGKEVQFPIPNRRQHSVRDLDSMVTAMKVWGSDGIVFHGRDAIVLVCDDDEDRRDEVRMPLTFSQPFSIIREWTVDYAWGHREFLNLLQREFSEWIGESIRDAFVKISVKCDSNVSQDLTRGRERGTQEFHRELQNAVDVPQELQFQVPVYDNPGLDGTPLHQLIVVAVEFDLESKVFRIYPRPGHVQAAIDVTHRQIGSLLENAGEETTVLYGSP